MKKLIQRINLKQQWKSDEKKILPVIKKILRSGNYVGSNIILDLEKKNCELLWNKICYLH